MPDYDATLTGPGSVFNLHIGDETGASWVLPRTYSQFEHLHMLLEGQAWSEERPMRPPFPEKALLPNLKRRADQLSGCRPPPARRGLRDGGPTPGAQLHLGAL